MRIYDIDINLSVEVETEKEILNILKNRINTANTLIELNDIINIRIRESKVEICKKLESTIDDHIKAKFGKGKYKCRKGKSNKYVIGQPVFATDNRLPNDFLKIMYFISSVVWYKKCDIDGRQLTYGAFLCLDNDDKVRLVYSIQTISLAMKIWGMDQLLKNNLNVLNFSQIIRTGIKTETKNLKKELK